jgi:hypothetical protein
MTVFATPASAPLGLLRISPEFSNMDTVNLSPGADDIPGRPTIADVIAMCRARARGETTARLTRPAAIANDEHIPVTVRPATNDATIPVTPPRTTFDGEQLDAAVVPVTIPVTPASTRRDLHIPVTIDPSESADTTANTAAVIQPSHDIPVTPKLADDTPLIPVTPSEETISRTADNFQLHLKPPDIPITPKARQSPRRLLPKTSPPPSGQVSLENSRVSGNTLVDIAARLITLLNRPMAKVVTALKPGLQGELIEINRDLVEQHLAGAIALTFCVLEGERSEGFASFIAWDYDVYAPHRIDVTARILGEIDPALTAAAFSTDGSDPHTRGKLILTLEEPIPPRIAYAFAREIRRRCLQQSDFGHVRAGDFDARPTALKGGLLRIGGRNILRGSKHVERFYSADGRRPSDLADVVPIARIRIEEITAALTGTAVVPMSWVRAWELQPWTYDTVSPPNTQGVVRRVCAIARAYAEHYGPKGDERFYRIIERIAENSPALNRPSPKNRDPKNTLRDKSYLERTWQFALASPSDWKPRTLIGSGIAPKLIEAYTKLVEYQHARGYEPRCHTMDCGRLAEMLGAGKMDAHRRIRRLEKSGLLVRHHPGRPMQRVPGGTLRGLSAIIGLVGENETPQHVRDFASRDQRALKLLAQRESDMKAAPIPRKIQTLQDVG